MGMEFCEGRGERSDRASERGDRGIERPLTHHERMEERTRREHALWSKGSTGDAPSEFTAWQGNPKLIEGIENRGYGGLESTKLTPCSISISNTTGWTAAQVIAQLEKIKTLIGLPSTDELVNSWWNKFEEQNQDRLKLVLRTAEEIGKRSETIDTFYEAYSRSRTNNIQAGLDKLDETREERRNSLLWREENPRGETRPQAEKKGTPADNLE